MRVSYCAVLGITLLLTGCSLAPTATPIPSSGRVIRGSVHGGQQPINGANIYLLAAGTSGYGSASASLLTSGTAGSDSIGGYVTSAPDGSFSISGDYACTPNTQVYLYALGGDPGAGTNTSAGLLAVLGNCPGSRNFASAAPYIWMNEVTTIAAAYALGPFAVDAIHIGSSGTALAQVGIANAFANAGNLVSLSTGAALSSTPAANGTVPQTELNTLANILASCVNSNGALSSTFNSIVTPLPCGILFSNAMNGSTAPSDTATAAINIAHNPAANVAALFAIPAPTAAFGPALGAQPADFTVTLNFTGGGITTPQTIAIDAAGNAWISDSSPSLDELSPLGAALSTSSGFSAPNTLSDLAIDITGNVWVADSGDSALLEYSSAGTPLQNLSAITGLSSPSAIAIDPTGNLWLNSLGVNNVTEVTSAGAYINNFIGGGLNAPRGIASDASGNIWIGNTNATSISQFNNSGVPNPSSPFSGDSVSPGFGPRMIAIDSTGDVWAMNQDSSISALNSSGVALSGPPYNTGTDGHANGLAIDGQNNLWALTSVTNEMNFTQTYGLLAFSSAGTPLLGASGHALPANGSALAIDGSGDVWIVNAASVSEVIGIAAPVVTPIAAAVAGSLIATLP